MSLYAPARSPEGRWSWRPPARGTSGDPRSSPGGEPTSPDLATYLSTRFGDRTALIEPRLGRRWTYRSLAEEAESWAALLEGRGVGSGDRVALLGPNRGCAVPLLMGCWKVGAALAPVNHRLAAEELQVEMARLQLRGAVVEESPEWTGRMQRWVPGATIPLRSPDPSPATRARGVPTSGESIGLILSTGGSTGPPKSAMLSVRAILSNALNTASSWDLRPDDVGLPLFPFFHTGGWNVLLLPLLAVGATSVVLERAEPGAVLAEILRTKATILSAVPTTLSDLVRLPGFEETDLGSLRFAKSGGGLTPEPVVRQFRQRGIAFYQGYGLTEAGPNLFYSAPEDLDRPGSVGRPTPLAELVLRNERGDTDTEGELWVRGPLTFSGYLGDSAATEAAMVDGWVATGDLLRRDVDGFHYFVG
ncbi:MAG: AMP-binding protein, partial [Thermoplasmata archaeon]|nr:AMP-binding protein [Thermoplasmata archaeon]